MTKKEQKARAIRVYVFIIVAGFFFILWQVFK